MTNYYHYTNQAGLQALKASGFIKESVRLDAGDEAFFRKGRIKFPVYSLAVGTKRRTSHHPSP